jgi:uncharacterized protein YbjT (DUF2867 family)
MRNIIITGATGMVGGLVLKHCLRSDEIQKVTSLVRRPSGVAYPKLHEIICNDYLRYEGLEEHFIHQDIAYFCIGAYTGQVPDELFKQITVDFTQGFADLLKRQSPEATFCFLSGQGADQTETSRMAFARYKGAAEKALLEIGFARVHLFRPGYIYPVTQRKEPNFMYRMTRVLYPVLRRLYPNIGISSEDLARAMVHAGLYGTGENENPVLENKDIRALEWP